VVDRLGGGDAFAGGFIAGYINDHDNIAGALALGSTTQALKHTMPGDLLCVTRDEIMAAMESTEGGVLQR
jgi:2-dehydro-3-deoxygluconokinase